MKVFETIYYLGSRFLSYSLFFVWLLFCLFISDHLFLSLSPFISSKDD